MKLPRLPASAGFYCGVIMAIIIKNKLTDKSSLIGKRGYSKGNSAADIVERKKYPKGYKTLKKAEKTLAPNEVMGKIKGRNIEVEKRFKSHAKEIALHDEVEKQKMRGKKK